MRPASLSNSKQMNEKRRTKKNCFDTHKFISLWPFYTILYKFECVSPYECVFSTYKNISVTAIRTHRATISIIRENEGREQDQENTRREKNVKTKKKTGRTYIANVHVGHRLKSVQVHRIHCIFIHTDWIVVILHIFTQHTPLLTHANVSHFLHSILLYTSTRSTHSYFGFVCTQIEPIVTARIHVYSNKIVFQSF